jgi:hypothetical protein
MGISRRAESSNRSRIRQVEKLENRSLLAGDCFHNIELPEDADGSGSVTPLDALVVINELNRSSTDASSASNTTNSAMVDIDGDSVLSPLDALQVINQINVGASTNSTTSPDASEDIEARIAQRSKAD